MMVFDLARYETLPFKERGRDHDGVDCWGLVHLIYRELFGLDLDDYGGDYDLSDKASLKRLIEAQEALAETGEGPWRRIEDEADLQPLDLVSFRIAQEPCHVGLCLGAWRRPASYLHIEDDRGVHGAPLHGVAWGRRRRRYYRHRQRPAVLPDLASLYA